MVLAASFWTRELAQQIGLNLPLYALEHHEVITETVDALEALDFEVRRCAIPWRLRTRVRRDMVSCVGSMRLSPEFWATEGIPPDFAEELLPPDLDRLEPHLLRVMERIPAFGAAGIKAVNNGPICYTPDGCPLLGPVGGHRGLWLAAGFCVGIGTGGGSGEFLANWMVDGAPPFELPIVYPSRFSRHTQP